MKRSQRTIVPKNIWDCMSPETQQNFQCGAQTDEDRERYYKGRENEMHDQFSSYLNRSGYSKKYIHPRMDKRTGIGIGTFDFTVWKCGRVAFVEFKTDKGRLTPEQKEFLAAQIAD